MLAIAVLFVVGIPLSVFLHETGHGLGAISASHSKAQIYLGNWNDNRKRSFQLGKLQFYLSWSYAGFCKWEYINKRQHLTALLGGPLLSLLAAGFFSILAQLIPSGELHTILNGLLYMNASIFLLTAIPITYPRWISCYGGCASDGLQLLRLMVKG
ncbi:hypothetical protein ACFO4L_06525 [Bacillus daqingensis]|uniref:Uncharacterized protein n=1 Tax=Bacillus daqingensis TaxID=872396 RepID=A0ABV9NV99_9BACI